MHKPKAALYMAELTNHEKYTWLNIKIALSSKGLPERAQNEIIYMNKNGNN